jgi:DNA replication factor GINS
MNLDELQSVQSRERQTDSLQQLRESFYADAGEFIQQLREEREAAADRADDPFDAPEVNRLTDDINTAEQTVEAIYERRVGKIVKMASLAAADMPAEEEGLTREERDLFETLVGAIENSRDHVLDVLAGEASPGAVAGGSVRSEETVTDAGQAQSGADSEPPAETTEPVDETSEPAPPVAEANDESGGVDAADVMGQSSDELPPEIPPEEPPEDVPVSDVTPGSGDDQSPASDGGTAPAPPETATASSGTENQSDGETATVDRTTVRITDDVGEIFGIDQREYDLSRDDVVTLPEENAVPLVERDAAEPLD